MLGAVGRSLDRTRRRLAAAVKRIAPAGRPDEQALEALEEALIAADVGPSTALRLVDTLRTSAAREGTPRERLGVALRAVLEAGVPAPAPRAKGRPHVIVMVGVNGTGKTTSAAKLGARLQGEGLSVLFGAADTFRAAAVEQLKVWAQRLAVPVIAHQSGGDPAAVVYDTCEAGRARNVDVIIIDTAGRLQTKDNLMAELHKMRRVAGKVLAGAPDEVLLVLDATTGQNGLRQAEDFLAHAGVTGLVLAKLDGSARGGVALSIADQLKLPICYVGTGEGIEDLAPFDADAYVEGLLGESQ